MKRQAIITRGICVFLKLPFMVKTHACYNKLTRLDKYLGLKFPVFSKDLTSFISSKGEATPVPIHFKENLKEILHYPKLVTLEYPKTYQSL
jgi:hypothetical protein